MSDIPQFSIIMPAYNSSAFIEKALKSIRSQQFTDYELIVVCDRCTDNTYDIAKTYGAQVYTVDYGCDGPTRNYGLEKAKGKWVLFIDDDDWFLHEYVLSLLNHVIGKNEEDILAFSFIWKGVGYAHNTPEHMFIASWSKCYRREFLKDIHFGANKDGSSDIEFYNGLLAKNPKVVYWDMPMYYYNYMREGSQSANNERIKNIAHNEEANLGSV